MKTYYLFGHEATTSFFDTGDIDEILENHIEHCVYCFDPNQDPTASKLLEAADGWDGCAQITKDQYMQLKSDEEIKNEIAIDDYFFTIYFLIAARITEATMDSNYTGPAAIVEEMNGVNGLAELTTTWTKEFIREASNKFEDDEYIDSLEAFCKDKLKNY